MSTFIPPTNNTNSCPQDMQTGKICGDGQACFLYPGGAVCQAYVVPTTYPPDVNALPAQPQFPVNSTATGAWYLSTAYPFLRYTGPVANQTANASCITAPIPMDFNLMENIVAFGISVDSNGLFTNYDSNFEASLLQYRGNCQEDFYCRPNNFTATPRDSTFSTNPLLGGQPGTCQPLLDAGATCVSSVTCKGWHVPNDGSDPAKFKTATLCGTSYGSNSNGYQCTAYTSNSPINYPLYFGIVLGMMALYSFWRYRQNRKLMRERQLNPGLHREAVYRQQDERDINGLPSYGEHRRDEQVTGQEAEEIGMYSFRTDGTIQPPSQGGLQPAPASPYLLGPDGRPLLGPDGRPLVMGFPPAAATGAGYPMYPAPQGPPMQLPYGQQIYPAQQYSAAAQPAPSTPPAEDQESQPRLVFNLPRRTSNDGPLVPRGPPRVAASSLVSTPAVPGQTSPASLTPPSYEGGRAGQNGEKEGEEKQEQDYKVEATAYGEERDDDEDERRFQPDRPGSSSSHSPPSTSTSPTLQ